MQPNPRDVTSTASFNNVIGYQPSNASSLRNKPTLAAFHCGQCGLCAANFQKGSLLSTLSKNASVSRPRYCAEIVGRLSRKATVKAGTLLFLKTLVNQLSKSCILDFLRCFAASDIKPLLS